jgi:DNA replication protein DnaC
VRGKFVWASTEVQVRKLATGAFLDAKRNAIFIGGTGTSKTHLCIGVASAVRGQFKSPVLSTPRGALQTASKKGSGSISVQVVLWTVWHAMTPRNS